MKQLRKRLTYANVMSSIAVFLVLGGGAAVAAGQLGKNTVGPKQLKRNAVTAAKLKNNAVTTAKLKNNAVTGAKVQNGSLSGADINVGTLGAVPNAAHANAADTADSAKTAASFERFVPFGIITVPAGGSATLVSYGPFSLIGKCEANANLDASVVFATTEDQTAFGGDDTSSGAMGPGTPESERTIEDGGASSSGPPVNSDGYDDQFNAQAPSGASWAGTVQSWAGKDAGQCRWSGYILKTS